MAHEMAHPNLTEVSIYFKQPRLTANVIYFAPNPNCILLPQLITTLSNYSSLANTSPLASVSWFAFSESILPTL